MNNTEDNCRASEFLGVVGSIASTLSIFGVVPKVDTMKDFLINVPGSHVVLSGVVVAWAWFCTSNSTKWFRRQLSKLQDDGNQSRTLFDNCLEMLVLVAIIFNGDLIIQRYVWAPIYTMAKGAWGENSANLNSLCGASILAILLLQFWAVWLYWKFEIKGSSLKEWLSTTLAVPPVMVIIGALGAFVMIAHAFAISTVLCCVITGVVYGVVVLYLVTRG